MARTSSGNRAATSSQKAHLHTKYFRAATKRQLVAATEPQHCGNLAANSCRRT
ncbi:hypothetical protein DPMN_166875 [Dreissena polymorpha]|uniref:Uncharacterized protein n=1 Tax=Dreissena polymorpha TaxID=45954 RepID=A0A9D4EYS8_DREPO|nr:hypothetical protein DPMN_166875 [Dreissena polymorpha]